MQLSTGIIQIIYPLLVIYILCDSQDSTEQVKHETRTNERGTRKSLFRSATLHNETIYC